MRLLSIRASFILSFILGINVVLAEKINKPSAGKTAIPSLLLESCYHLHFRKADSLMAQIRKNPDQVHPVDADLLEANLLWWKIISGFKGEAIRKQINRVLDHAENLQRKEVSDKTSGHIRKLTIQGFRSRMAILDHSYLSGFFSINSSLHLFRKLLGKEKENPVLLIFNGLYHYYCSRNREDYLFLRPFLALFPESDKEKGLEMLLAASSCGVKDIQTEANYFLMKIFMDEKKYSQALRYSGILCSQYPGNSVFQYYRFCCLLKSGNAVKAAECESSLLDGIRENPEFSEEHYQFFRQLCKKARAS